MHDHLSMGLLAQCPLCLVKMEADKMEMEHPEDCPEGLKHRIEFDVHVKEGDDARAQS